MIGLEAEREIIYDRINQRVDSMIKEGLVKEAEGLFPNKELNALQTVGYRELFDYFEGKISLEFAIEEIKKNTRRFSKRQLTWFKRAENVAWFDFMAGRNDIIEFINSKKEITNCK
jgi:tRNA dimethylallyltransferase